MSLPFHPLANLFPLIEGAEFEAFVADIRAHGVRELIVILDGQILDGRNRYRAASAAGADWLDAEERQLAIGSQHTKHFVAYDYVDPQGDPLKFVLSLNMHRRHLGESQRAMIAAEIATMGQGRPSEWRVPDDKPANLPDLSHVEPAATTQAEAAELLHVSERSVRTARTVREDGAPELVDAVKRGEVAVSAAAELSSLPVTEQLEILRTADPRAISRIVKERRAEVQVDKRERRDEREAELAQQQRTLPAKRYGVILEDPEWRFEPYSRASGMDRAPDNHYPTSSLEAIKARDVASIAADDCVLFLWATAPMLPQALEVMAAHGFAYKSHIIWRKAEKYAAGLVLGTGYWFRNGHELLLVGTRGKVPAPAPGTQWASMFDAPPRRHSEKPDAVYELIESYFPNLPKIELNARARRAGWDAWGLEAPDDVVDDEEFFDPSAATPEDAGSATLLADVAGEVDPSASPVLDALTRYQQLVAADEQKGKHTWATAEPIVRAAYACDPVIPSKTLAADLGSPIGSVLGWAGRHGLTRPERRGGPDGIGRTKEAEKPTAPRSGEDANRLGGSNA